ncbi:MAG: hypothetical protein ACFFE4_00475 [Candidatus Thorarchaeota archaeon]
MADIITKAEVFSFMGTDASEIANQGTMIDELIPRKQKDLEQTIGRKVEATSFSNILFQHNLNCKIHKEKLFLQGIYRDTYSITSLYELNVALVAAAGYNDGGDYYIDTVKGVIYRINNFWSLEQLGIKISGSLGLVSGGNPLPNIKQILIEMVAAASGLWRINTETEQGTITTIKTTIRKETENKIRKYTLLDY